MAAGAKKPAPASEGHFGKKALDKLHEPPVDGDAGLGIDAAGCLTGHLDEWPKKKNKQNSCNYRWQCHVSNKGNDDIKDRLHTYITRFPGKSIKTDTRVKPSSADWLKNYSFDLPKPEPGDWHLDGPTRKKPRNAPLELMSRQTFSGRTVTNENGMNFEGALWPYYNNAHHIVPKGTFRATITKCGSKISNIIQQALLEAKYNVNHGHNMIFLPMDKQVGAVIRLPRHLIVRALRSHPDYDKLAREYSPNKVKSMKAKAELKTRGVMGIEEIVAIYKKDAEDALKAADPKKHPLPKGTVSKKKLQSLSGELLKLILAWGLIGADALDTHAKRV